LIKGHDQHRDSWCLTTSPRVSPPFAQKRARTEFFSKPGWVEHDALEILAPHGRSDSRTRMEAARVYARSDLARDPCITNQRETHRPLGAPRPGKAGCEMRLFCGQRQTAGCRRLSLRASPARAGRDPLFRPQTGLAAEHPTSAA